MIRFVCTCGYAFEVPDELAGDSLQCPDCGLLRDVPVLSELGAVNEDFTYQVDNTPIISTDPNRMAELEIIYAKSKVDEEGNEIDLRTVPGGRSLDDAEGEYELGPKDDPRDASHRPKYDPETGELIRPLEVQKPPDHISNPASIPMAKPALDYARGALDVSVHPLKIPVELLMPLNVVVMGFVFLYHIFNGFFFVATVGLFFLWPAFFIAQGLLIAHYGNVIDDIGRNEVPDLPRPLREMSFYDDMWAPFVSMFGGFIISCALPIVLVGFIGQAVNMLPVVQWLIGIVLGSVFVPAILITTNTSGSTANLRPDRVFAVMRACGWHYPVTVLVWLITWPIYFVGWMGLNITFLQTFVGRGLPFETILFDWFGIPYSFSRAVFLNWLVVGPALLIGVYLMHAFCWYLGLLYKAHQPEFPWVLQRHIRDPNKHNPQSTHADRLRRRRPASGHLPMIPPPPPPPPSVPRAG